MSMDVRVGNADDLKVFRDTIMTLLEKSITGIKWNGDDGYWLVEAAGGSRSWISRWSEARWRVSIRTFGISLEGVVRPHATCFFEVIPDTLNFPEVRFDITVINVPPRANDYMLQDSELVDRIAKIIREQGASKSRLAAFLGI